MNISNSKCKKSQQKSSQPVLFCRKTPFNDRLLNFGDNNLFRINRYSFLSSCWNFDPEARPTYSKCVEFFDDHFSENQIMVGLIFWRKC